MHRKSEMVQYTTLFLAIYGLWGTMCAIFVVAEHLVKPFTADPVKAYTLLHLSYPVFLISHIGTQD